MPGITLKDIPEDLHAQLKAEADANFRSLTQEALAPIERNFAFQDKLTAARVNAPIGEAMRSGDEKTLTRQMFDAARLRARQKFSAKHKAA